MLSNIILGICGLSLVVLQPLPVSTFIYCHIVVTACMAQRKSSAHRPSPITNKPFFLLFFFSSSHIPLF